MLEKKIWPSFQRIIELFTQKFVTKLLKVSDWDPGSEIWDIGDAGSGSATLVKTLERRQKLWIFVLFCSATDKRVHFPHRGIPYHIPVVYDESLGRQGGFGRHVRRWSYRQIIITHLKGLCHEMNNIFVVLKIK